MAQFTTWTLHSGHLLQSYHSSEEFYNLVILSVINCRQRNSWEKGGRNVSIPITKKIKEFFVLEVDKLRQIYVKKLAVSFSVIQAWCFAEDKKVNIHQNISGGFWKEQRSSLSVFQFELKLEILLCFRKVCVSTYNM